MDSYDLIIVGGGIAGGALATVMARSGASVLVLERSTIYPDRVRGEWIAPWGVVEAKALGLYDLLLASGGHHVTRHITFGEEVTPEKAIENAADLRPILDIGGPLCIRHPVACQALADEAVAAGACLLRGVSRVAVTTGSSPTVEFEQDGTTRSARARLVVGADGRNGVVRAQCGMLEEHDETHHLFTGMLVENARDWPDDVQTKGTEGDVNFLAFPQGNGVVRLYLGYGLDQKTRLAGKDAQRCFLDAFRLDSLPAEWASSIANGTPASWCHSYPNEDTWVDVPYTDGVVLVGDSAGHNDPIIGQGLSITLRDVRMVAGFLRSSTDWRPEMFAPYAEERRERLRRLRFSAWVRSVLDSEFGPRATERRVASGRALAANPSLGFASGAVMAGPEPFPAQLFSAASWAAIVGEDVPYPASLSR